jgi:hypothetical protein
MNGFVVSYERKFSDGQYGSEGLSLSWSWEPEDDEEPVTGQLETTVQFLRTLVLTELSKSAAEGVRYRANHELNARDGVPVKAPPDDWDLRPAGPETMSAEDLPF